ncbi:MAG: TM1802 family CRISPR-associated protein [bacterium]|jgi:hypothetical protein
MKLDWLEKFSDPYLQTPGGQGVFLGGVVLGMVAQNQIAKGEGIDASPLFKQIMFGKMQRRDLLRHLSRVPELLRAYDINYKFYLQTLTGRAGELLLQGKQELGVDGNFAFSVAFLNANEYFWRIFGKTEGQNHDAEERGEA